MKNLRLIGFLMMLASSALLVNCTSDPIAGPDGTAGIDGLDGLDGIDGLDSTADCRSCHSKQHTDPIVADYAMAAHATGSSWARGSSSSCAQCHSNEGFIDFQEMGFVSSDGLTKNPITCNGCRNPIDGHRSFDFDTDGNDYALRTLAPVELIIDSTYVIDSKNDSDLLGTSNTCVNCHQPRSGAPTADDLIDDMFPIPSHWGPHHGAQGTMLEGLGGAEIAGSVTYPEAGKAVHKAGASCISCHMGETTDGTDGGHTWNATANSCLECHDSAPGAVAGLEASRAALLVALQDKGVFDAEGELIDTNPLTMENAQAAWNYIYLDEDSSNGVHNPEYAKALIQNSIELLQ